MNVLASPPHTGTAIPSTLFLRDTFSRRTVSTSIRLTESLTLNASMARATQHALLPHRPMCLELGSFGMIPKIWCVMTRRSILGAFLLVARLWVGNKNSWFVAMEHVTRLDRTFFGIHNEFWDHLRQVQFVQTAPGTIEVRLVLHEQSNRTWLKDFLNERFAGFELKFVERQTIPPTRSGKHRYFLSLVK